MWEIMSGLFWLRPSYQPCLCMAALAGTIISCWHGQMISVVDVKPKTCLQSNKPFCFFIIWVSLSARLQYDIMTFQGLTLYVLNFSEGTKIYIYVFMSFLHIDMIQVVDWNHSSSMTRTYLFYIVNIMGADVLSMQRARASATMTFTMFNRINLVPAREGLRCLWNFIVFTNW